MSVHMYYAFSYWLLNNDTYVWYEFDGTLSSNLRYVRTYVNQSKTHHYCILGNHNIQSVWTV